MIPTFAIPRIKRGLSRNQMKIRLKRLRAINRALTVQDIRKGLQFPGFDPYTIKIYMNIEEGIMYQVVPPGVLFPDGRILINAVSENAFIDLLPAPLLEEKYRYTSTIKKFREQRFHAYLRYLDQGQISGTLTNKFTHSSNIVGSFKMTGLKLGTPTMKTPHSLEANEITIFHKKPLDKSISFDTTLNIKEKVYFEYGFGVDLLRIGT